MATTPFNDNAQLALEEMRLQMGRVFQASDSLDQKANFLLAGSGLLITLAVALMPRMFTSLLQTLILVAAALLFAAMTYFVLRALAPAIYHGPIKADYAVLEEYVLNEPADDALANMIAGYVARIEQNKAINDAKALAINRCMVLFAVILLLLVLAAAL